MVCKRCISSVEDILTELEIPFNNVELGIIHFENIPSNDELDVLQKAIEKVGFEFIGDSKKSLVNKIKTGLIQLLEKEEIPTIKLSDYIKNHLDTNYPTISQLFSAEEGITIEKYFILLKIEKAKELLSYQNLSLKEVTYKLNYSSVAHLSKQFKEIVGLSPSQYIKQDKISRKSLDEV